jgi:hypothetical protein
MLLLTLANCSIIIAALLIADEKALADFEIIDKVFFGFYALEVILKVKSLFFYERSLDWGYICISKMYGINLIFLLLLFNFYLILCSSIPFQKHCLLQSKRIES